MKKTHYICTIVALCSFFLLSIVYADTFGVKKKRPKPHEFGNVIIDNFSTKQRIPPVEFKHWLHRSKYTCRLCHVDIGFGMVVGDTQITCDDIEMGMYCGSCHDGKESFARVEQTPGGKKVKKCDMCHSVGKDVNFKYDFFEFKKKKGFKRERFGNGIDWEEAEERGIIDMKDFLPGISFTRTRDLKKAKELQFATGEAGMPDILFSHKKHTIWSGCELCHPEIFGVKAGETVYSMQDIFNNRYCGACHGIVAFPNNDCTRCHTRAVY
jgi:c(7)-type cytochrome triheme protein